MAQAGAQRVARRVPERAQARANALEWAPVSWEETARPVRPIGPAGRPTRHPASPARSARPRTRSNARRRARRPVTRRRIVIRRVVALAVVTFLAVQCLSFAAATLGPSNVGFGVRAVEWLRGHGAAWLVNDVERTWYTLNAPSKGGAALKTLPTVGLSAAGAPGGYAPPPIAPAISPALPAEGRWHATGPVVAGGPPVLVTTFRPDPSYPQMVAGLAWIDHTRTSLSLYPGRYEPPSAAVRGPLQVPVASRPALLATFNSGFKLSDSHGGFAALGHADAPLRDGMATLVGYRNGSVDVVSWSGGPQPGANVLFARQNLPLLLQGGRLDSRLSDDSLWGATLGNAVRVWRSGIGVNARGDLVYAAADNQTASSLALILQRAGAVRAMELDINYEWTTFNFYAASNAARPSKLLPGMSRDVTRYLTPDDRDFFAVYAAGAH